VADPSFEQGAGLPYRQVSWQIASDSKPLSRSNFMTQQIEKQQHKCLADRLRQQRKLQQINLINKFVVRNSTNLIPR
jgi:hypothetical protein